MKIAVSVVLLLALAAGGAWWWTEQKRAEEWAKVDRALTRLEAGMDHESRILLRSTIADAAAALSNYTRGSSTRGGEPHVVAAQRAIDHLDIAMQDLGGTYGFREIQSKDWASVKVQLLPRESLSPRCNGSKAYLFGATVEAAHFKAARDSLADIRLNRERKVEALDADAEDQKCGVAAQQRKQQNEVRWLAWPLRVEVRSASPNVMKVIVDQGPESEVVLYSGRMNRIGARREVMLIAYNPEDLTVTVNGRRWSPDWRQEDQFSIYSRASITLNERARQ